LLNLRIRRIRVFVFEWVLLVVSVAVTLPFLFAVRARDQFLVVELEWFHACPAVAVTHVPNKPFAVAVRAI